MGTSDSSSKNERSSDYIYPCNTCILSSTAISQEECISTFLKRCRRAGSVTTTMRYRLPQSRKSHKQCAYLDFSGISGLVLLLSQEQPFACIDLTSSIPTSPCSSASKSPFILCLATSVCCQTQIMPWRILVLDPLSTSISYVLVSAIDFPPKRR